MDTCLGREWQWSISTNWKVRVPHTKNEIKQSKRQSRTGFAHLTSTIDGAGFRGNKNNSKIHSISSNQQIKQNVILKSLNPTKVKVH